MGAADTEVATEALRVAEAISSYTPASLPVEAVTFAREVVLMAAPSRVSRARALLFATSRLGTFGTSVGLEARPDVLLCESVIERFILASQTSMAAPTVRTLRTNLRYVAVRATPHRTPRAVGLPRERAKAPYTQGEVAAYLVLADTQPTLSRRMRAGGLICLGAGAGLVGADLRAVGGLDVISRSGGVVIEVAGKRPRRVPVLARYHHRLIQVSAYFGEDFIIGGVEPTRRNVTSALIASLAGGIDLPRLELGRLRSTWLAAVAERIGLRAFMDAAGISCSQRLGDIVATLPAIEEDRAVTLLGASQ